MLTTSVSRPPGPRRLRVPLTVPLAAAAAYLLNLVVQIPVFAALRELGPSPFVAAVVLAPAVFGVCEELVRYTAFGLVPVLRRHRTADGARAAGLGHGGAEVVALAVTYGVFGGGWASFGLFVVGRVLALAVHVGFATLVVLAHRRSTWLLLVAVVAHVVVDASTFALAPYGAWQFVPFALWASLAVAFVVLVRRRGLLPRSGAGPATASAAPERVIA